MSENVCLVLVKLGLRRAPGEGGGGEDGVYHISGVSGGLERASKYMSNKKIFLQISKRCSPKSYFST